MKKTAHNSDGTPPWKTALVLFVFMLIAVTVHCETKIAFIVKQNDKAVSLQPLFPARVGVEQASGPLVVNGELLFCELKDQKQRVKIETGELAIVHTMTLVCDKGKKFVVRDIQFEK